MLPAGQRDIEVIAAVQRHGLLPSIPDGIIVDKSNSADKVVDTKTDRCVSNDWIEEGRGNSQSIKLDPSAPEQTLLLKTIILFQPLMNPLVLFTILVRVTYGEHKTSKPASPSWIVASTILEVGIEEVATKGVVGPIAHLQKLVH